MSSGRRDSSDSRRRRVLVYQSLCQEEAPNAAERRKVEQLRRARRLPTTYGGNVNRRLRGRWFSLVPVRRRAMAACGVVILGVVALLCLGHWAATGWQLLAERPEAARPLRLDRADSFGTWVRAFFLAATTGTTILVYQLRRYRNDDYRGSYRIWPPVIILIGLASLNAVAGLIPWAGELIDWLLGRRVALAGGDWLRIVLTVGGAALALRLLAEVRSSRLALVLMLATVTFFAIPLAAHWGILSQETRFRWLLVSCSPLIASALLWLASGAYLRRLFREVRRMDEDDPVSLRWQQMKANFWQRWSKKAEEDEPSADVAAKPTRVAKTKVVEPARGESAAVTMNAKVTKKPAEQPAGASPATPDDAVEEPTRRRFGFGFGFGFLFRKKRPAVDAPETHDVAAGASEPAKRTAATETAPSPAVKPLPAVKSAPAEPVAGRETAKPAPPKAVAKPAVAEAEDEESEQPAVAKSGWFSGWFGRKKAAAAAAETAPAATVSVAKSDRAAASGDEDDESFEDDPSIDWSKMNKAERRRMRREIKRTA
jgi:hypothetical protein